MTESANSSVRVGSAKPVNVFYVWYSELCRRLNSNPVPIVKPTKNKCKTVLDFVADRLKLEEWSPVINALRHDTSLHVINIRSRILGCEFLHEVDTEEKARKLKRKYGALWTAYILKNLLRSLSCSVKNTQVLTCLELDGLPMFAQYLEPLLQAMKRNNTIKSLSFANCVIKDCGCEMVCGYLRFTPNVEIINLSACGLTSASGTHIAKLVKFQQINRYCESWHRSLRYEVPDCKVMRGIKRITLNRNPLIGDEGLCYILKELEDDLWIKALDVQKCGITDQIADRIFEVLDYSKSLEILDLRQNEYVHLQTIEKVLNILKDRQMENYDPEFHWCETDLSLPYKSMVSLTNISLCVGNKYSKEAPSEIHCNKTVKISSTTTLATNHNDAIDNKKQINKLSAQLEREITKRKATEKKNVELRRNLKECKSHHSISKNTNKGNFKTIISAIERLKPVPVNSMPMLKNKQDINNTDETSNKQPRSIFTAVKNGTTLPDACPKNIGDDVKNGFHKNGLHNGVKYKNGHNGLVPDLNASNLFEQFIKSATVIDNALDEDEEFLKVLKAPQAETNNDQFESTSETSLANFIEELKTTSTTKRSSTNHPK